jgi:D-arabinose 1-dehydrogenase-like Zn-dependent alcohol dehydrogenase
VVVGLYGGAVSLSLPLLVMRAVTVSGSYVGSRDDLRQLIDLARRERLPPLPVKARPLEDAGAVLAELKAGKIIGRVVLHP